jgi:hypothetical protein
MAGATTSRWTTTSRTSRSSASWRGNRIRPMSTAGAASRRYGLVAQQRHHNPRRPGLVAAASGLAFASNEVPAGAASPLSSGTRQTRAKAWPRASVEKVGPTAQAQSSGPAHWERSREERKTAGRRAEMQKPPSGWAIRSAAACLAPSTRRRDRTKPSSAGEVVKGGSARKTPGSGSHPPGVCLKRAHPGGRSTQIQLTRRRCQAWRPGRCLPTMSTKQATATTYPAGPQTPPEYTRFQGFRGQRL